MALFEPAYISGWSAANHWGLTEQIYRTTVVVAQRILRSSAVNAGGADFVVRSIKQLPSEGRETVWRGRTKVSVAAPAQTLVDMLDVPALGPGMREVSLTILAYLRSERRDDELLLRCAEERANGAVFKRLGFILESTATGETRLIKACLARLTTGYARLDPTAKRRGPMRSRWRVVQNVDLPIQET